MAKVFIYYCIMSCYWYVVWFDTTNMKKDYTNKKKDSYGNIVDKQLSFDQYWDDEDMKLKLSMDESDRQRNERLSKINNS